MGGAPLPSIPRFATAEAPIFELAKVVGATSIEGRLEYRPSEIDPDDGTEQVDEDEDIYEDGDQLTGVDDDLASGVQVRHDRLD